MRTALTIVIYRNGQSKVIAGPHVSIDQQIAEFKKCAKTREDAKLLEMQLWVSDAGITKRLKFRDPQVEKKTEVAATAAELAEQKRLADEAQAKSDRLAVEQGEQLRQEQEQRAAQEKTAAERKAAGATPIATEPLTGLAKFNADRRAAAERKAAEQSASTTTP